MLVAHVMADFMYEDEFAAQHTTGGDGLHKIGRGWNGYPGYSTTAEVLAISKIRHNVVTLGGPQCLDIGKYASAAAIDWCNVIQCSTI